MIVRILHEGQFALHGASLETLSGYDHALLQSVEASDDRLFHQTLKEVLDLIHTQGQVIPADQLVESDLVLPHEDISLEEARDLFLHLKG